MEKDLFFIARYRLFKISRESNSIRCLLITWRELFINDNQVVARAEDRQTQVKKRKKDMGNILAGFFYDAVFSPNHLTDERPLTSVEQIKFTE